MPFVEMKFNLPDEKPEFLLAQKGADCYCVLWEMQLWLCKELEYKETKPLRLALTTLNELLERYNVDLQELSGN